MSAATLPSKDGDRDGVLRRALTEIRDLRARLGTVEAAAREPIAVIGTACRLPGGVGDPEGLWQFLRAAGDGIGDVPAERGMGGAWRGGFLAEIDQFDAGLFGISPREAATLDPQQRLFLEVAWEALERAGQPLDRMTGIRAGVFLGVTNYDYCQRIMQEVAEGDLEAHCLTSNASTFAAGRLSYLLGLSGPSLSIDTACSSSLVATHLACQSLRSGDSDMAIAAGVNVLLSPEWFSVLSRASMLSPDGYCHTFDSSANGYVRGEGCVAVVLKRLSDAIRDRDPIAALLRGSSVNQDGKSSGLTVPNPAAQRAVIAGALRAAAIEPTRVSYVEAHGTGTPLGDPIEVRSLTSVLRPAGRPAEPLALGSIKANIGHLEPAAGLAGLLKVIVAMQHRELPPQVRFESLNPEIDPDGTVIHTAPTAWTDPRGLVAGVSSFGASGTNAHVVLEEAPATAAAVDQPGARVALLSARSRPALQALAARHAEHLRQHPGLSLADVAFTLAAGRARFAHRVAIAASTTEELAGALDGFARGAPSEDAPTGRADPAQPPRTAFLFTGQGSQYVGMGRDLHASEPVFRAAIDEAEAVLEPILGLRLTDLLFDGGPAPGSIDETRYTQPAMVALEVALARLWQGWGVTPEAVIGHSVGEYAAMVVAGVLDFPDALRLIARRGAAMQALRAQGLMASVFAPVERVAAITARDPDVAIAAVNGPDHVVLSGGIDAVESMLIRLTSEGIRHRCLVTSHAFHSALIEPALDELEEAASGVVFRDPAIPLVSNLTGRPLEPGALGPRYLRDHARGTVQFEAGARWLLDEGFDAFVEMGPTPTLVGMVRRMAGADPEGTTRRFLPSLRPMRGERTTILTSLGSLFVAGAPLDGDALAAPGARRAVLATYPFERKKHWYTPSPGGTRSRSAAAGAAGGTSLLGRRVDSPLAAHQFLASFDPSVHPCLAECVVAGSRIVNVGVYTEVILQAAARLGIEDAVVRELGIRAPMLLETDEPPAAQVVLTPLADGSLAVAVHGERQGVWLLHAEAILARAGAAAADQVDLDAVRGRCTARRTGFEFYEGLWRRQLFLGPSAQWIDEVWGGPREALARMRAPRPGEAGGYRLHPGLLDACCQLFFAAMPAGLEPTAIYMIAAMGEIRLVGAPPAGPTFCRVSLRDGGDLERGFVGDVVLTDEQGGVIARVGAVTMRRATPELLRAAIQASAARTTAAPAARGGDAAGAEGSASAAPPAVGVADELAALGAAARAARAEEVVAAVVAGVLRCAPGDVDRGEGLGSMGLDSLLALELKDALTRRTGATLPLGSFLDGSVRRLAADLVAALVGDAGPAVETAPAARAEAPAPARDSASASASAGSGQADPAANEPFALTDLQQAYLLGRGPGFELGGVSTQFLLEVDVVGIDLARLSASMDELIARHDMMRAVMTPDGRQRILPVAPPFAIRTDDLRGRGPRETEERLGRTHDQLADQVLPADRCPMLEIRASLLDGGVTRLHLVFDALVIDAWSTSLFLHELSEVYHRGAAGLAPIGLGFRDYVARLADPARDAERARARAYWEGRMGALPPAPDLPLRVQPSAIERPRFAHRSFTVPPDRWAQLKARAREAGLTPTSVLCAAYAEVLATWSRSSRFTLNLLFFNRQPVHPDVGKVVGNFSATTLLEVDADPSADLQTRARTLGKQLWQDLDHAAMSGVEVLRELNRRRAEPSRAGMPVVFASTIGFAGRDEEQGLGLAQPIIGLGESGREVHTSIRTPQVWLDHQVMEREGELVANWDCVEELFPEGLIDDMFAAYRGLVDRLADDRAAWTEIGRAHVPAAQLERRRRDNPPVGEVPRGRLHEPFQRSAARTPDAPAVIAPDRTLSYRELDRLANGIARWLRDRGAGREDRVAVMLDKGWAQVAAVLGVLKAHAAYVPIDPQLPRERRRVLLEQIQTRWVITQVGVDPGAGPEVTLDVLRADTGEAGEADHPPPGPASEADLAYVIFTSGSTGTPKGVMIEHRAALNTIVDINRRFAVGPTDRVLALSSLSFDLSVYDVFGTLAAGGAIVMPACDRVREPQHWLELVHAHRVTLWNSVPALLEMMVEHAAGRAEGLAALRLVMLSGDWIGLQLPARIRALGPQVDVHSLGGATEASIWSIGFPVGEVDPAWASIPYGRPLTNQHIHVLDGALRPCPIWRPGRIFIGGVGVARGYLGDPDRTAASFVTHPVTGERLYDTGDLGRYLPSGDVELLGREDLQVKVQGFRIELGEIEATLQQHPSVRAAVVSATGERLAGKRLVAHLVLGPGNPPGFDEIRDWLRERLPSYAVPNDFTRIDAVPLSANGKVDRSALRVEELADRVAIDRPPVTELEKTLAGFFAELLQRETVRCGASFFELGGNSLLAVQLVGKIRARFGREVPLSALFEHQSVERLARALEARVAAPTRTPLVAIQARGARPPLFCVHPVGGNVGCYVPLARELGESIPLWGIQAVSGDDEELTIAGLARRYVAAIREREARGPYRLAGWSMGGVIAYEMAQQLHAAGERVASLVLIDVGQEPAPRSKRRPSDADLLAWFERDLLRLTGATAAVGAAADPAGPGGSPISRVRDRLVAAGALPAELGADEVGAWFERFTGNMRALVGYRATRYPGPLWFARGTEGASRAVADAWARRSAVGEVIDLPGDHYTVMQEAGALAGAIRRALREGESRPVARALASSEPKTRPASYQEGEGGR